MRLPRKTPDNQGRWIELVITVAKSIFAPSGAAVALRTRWTHRVRLHVLIIPAVAYVHRHNTETHTEVVNNSTIHCTARYTVLPYTPSYISRAMAGGDRASERVNRKITIRHIAGRSSVRSVRDVVNRTCIRTTYLSLIHISEPTRPY